MTKIFDAIKNNNLEQLEAAIKEGADINKARDDGFTPLFIAAENGHSEVVKHLLAKEGIEVNKAANNGFTPLHVAARKGHVNIGVILLIHGANFDIVKIRGDFSEFYDNAINDIAQGIIDYDEYRLKELAFAMGDHSKLGAKSDVRKINDDIIITILDLARPRNIIFEDLPEKLRDPVQLRINKLQQEKDTTPASDLAAKSGKSILTTCRIM
jgi:hypothetical protein